MGLWLRFGQDGLRAPLDKTVWTRWFGMVSDGLQQRIIRHPSWNELPGKKNISCLDYSDPEERKEILSIMTSLKQEVINKNILEN
jgi:hypothetical protein